MAQADELRRVMSKKKRELIGREREKFTEGCVGQGYLERVAKSVFDLIEPFADYGFPAAHACAYGYVAYQTAYLKAHHPVEYMSAVLTSVKDDKDRKPFYLNACRLMGLEVLPPDVNESEQDFAPASSGEAKIRYGLSAVRNVGGGLVGQLLAEREANGPYASFHDFADRVPEPVLNKRAVESLIKAGAFDSLGHPRRGLLGVFEQVTNTTLSRRRERELGVMSLFGESEQPGADAAYDERLPVPDVEFDKVERLRHEKEMLGLYVSDHPLFGKEGALRRKVEQSIADLDDLDDGTSVHIGGVVTGLSRRFTKRGDQMATFTLEDLAAEVEITLFPRTLLEHGHKLADDVIVAVRGRLDKRDESRTTVICQGLEVLAGLDDGAPTLTVNIPAVRLGPTEIDRLKHVLAAHPGASPVVLDLGTERVRLTEEFCVDLDRVVPEIRMAFGHSAIAL
jgi:DNA polymerase-3 subunit alpha